MNEGSNLERIKNERFYISFALSLDGISGFAVRYAGNDYVAFPFQFQNDGKGKGCISSKDN